MENNIKFYAKALLKQHIIYIILLLSLAIGAGCLTVLVRYTIRGIIDAVIASEPVFYLLVLFGLCKLGHHGMYFFNRLVDIRYKPLLSVQVVTDLYNRVMRQSLHWFDSTLSGDIISKITDFQTHLIQLISVSFKSLVSLFSIIISLLFLARVHYIPAVWLASFIIIYVPVMYTLLRKQLTRQRRSALSKQAAIGALGDSIGNSFIIKIMGDYQTDYRQMLQPALATWRYWDRTTRVFNAWWVDNTDTFLITVLSVGQLYSLIQLYQNGVITAGGFAFTVMITLGIHRELDGIMESLLMTINPAIAVMSTAYAFINQPYDIKDKPTAIHLPKQQYAITYDRVVFQYEPGGPRALDGINLTIAPGDRVGIVGISGSGKTTLIRSLLRYKEVASGRILIGDTALSDITQASLYNLIGIVPQDITLFHRSIAANIRVANPTASDAAIQSVCKKALLHDVIMAMPDGYDTRVGERGVKLSGGQRQRVAIARAMLSEAPILILDEATSSLDSPTEAKIQVAIQALITETDATVISIAHRLSTLSTMNRIIVIEAGKIVESGTHATLHRQPDSTYRRLWDAQSQYLGQ